MLYVCLQSWYAEILEEMVLTRGVAGLASEAPLEGVASNAVRARGQLYKASVATDCSQAVITEPNS